MFVHAQNGEMPGRLGECSWIKQLSHEIPPFFAWLRMIGCTKTQVVTVSFVFHYPRY